MKRSADPRKFLTPEEARRVTEAVAAAERRTSAEIKVMIVRHCWDDIRRKAAAVFRRSGLELTARRNCAMILLVTTNREFLIHGDRGIHEKVGQGFWDGARDAMAERFRAGDFGAGLVEGVRRIGGKLAEHFPRAADDRNEIPDGVGYEK
jgi:uncharacterized membrane protein